MGEIDGFQVLASFSDDEMEGFVTVISSSEPRQPIPDIDQLVQEIKRQGIVFGLDMERVWQALHDYNDGKPVQNYSVALGQPVEEGMDGRIEFKIDMSVQPKIVDSRVDYKEIDQFKSVEKGDLLAVKWKPRPGSRGTTVTGMAKSPRTGKTTLLFPGKNVVTQENTDAVYFYAGENGYVIVQSDRLSVFPVLTIKKDVDFSIGNIRFKGDVTIMGDVLPDFVVETTGKVTIYGTVLGSRIEAGGAVTIRGVSGKDKGMVLSNEDIDISYVERGNIEGKKDVYVKTGVLNSTVLCYGKFYGDSPGGRIMESVIKAGQGIMAFNVGSPFTKRLDLICGMDVEKEKQLETANENLNNLVVELRQLKQKYGEENLKTQELAYFLRQYSGSKQVETDYHRYKELGALIQDCYNLVKQLQGEAFNVNAMVKVKGVVYPGTRIVIGEYELLVPKELHNVVFYKNTEEGAVKMDLRNQRVGVCQFRPLLGDIEKNLSKHLEWVERGREGGADFLVFPELSLTGYRLRDLAGEVAVEADSPFWKPLQEASREMTLLVGFVEKDRDGVLYNSMALFKPGCTSPFIYRKLRLPNFGMFEEKRFFKAGEKLGICETVLGRTGLLVCRDFLFPSLAYCHFSQGVKVIVCPSNAPLRGVEGAEFDSQRLWEDAAAAYSRFFSALVVYVNRTGFEDGYGFAGGSFVMEPGAKMVWKAPPLEETLGIVEFDKRCFARYEALSGYLKEEDHGQIRRFLLSEGR